MNLISQQIENLNIGLKSAFEANKFLSKDWIKIEINKEERKILQYKLSSYIKAGKAN